MALHDPAHRQPLTDWLRDLARTAAALRPQTQFKLRPTYADDLTPEQWAAADAEHASLDAYGRGVRL